MINYLIIGGGIAGTTAAETIRQQDKKGSIAIVSQESYPLYSRAMLSKPDFIFDKISEDAIWLKNPSWYRENRIDLILGKEAIKLDPEKKIVSLDNGTELSYQKLLLAIGACPKKCDIPGAGEQGVFYLRTLDDVKAIKAVLKTAKQARLPARQAVVIGGGLVGFEVCKFLRAGGLDVTLVIRKPHFLDPILDQTSGQMVENALEKGGVKIIRNTYIKQIEKNPSQIVFISIGTFCPFEWLKQAGIETNGGILANEYLETNIPSIWTAGDAAEFNDIILGERIQMRSWINAQAQGRTAGLNMLGRKEIFKLVSFHTSTGFGIIINFIGDVRPLEDRSVICQGTKEQGWIVRLIIKEERIVGAILINRQTALPSILKAIEDKIKASELKL